MLHCAAVLAGRFDHGVIDSVLLRDNPLGDPCERPLLVYSPPGYDEDRDRRYPVIYVTPGCGGPVCGSTGRRPGSRTRLG